MTMSRLRYFYYLLILRSSLLYSRCHFPQAILFGFLMPFSCLENSSQLFFLEIFSLSFVLSILVKSARIILHDWHFSQAIICQLFYHQWLFWSYPISYPSDYFCGHCYGFQLYLYDLVLAKLFLCLEYQPLCLKLIGSKVIKAIF